jgi:hypothetical protein
MDPLPSILNLEQPQSSYDLDQNGFCDVFCDMLTVKSNVGFIYTRTEGKEGNNRVRVNRMFDLITHFKCNNDITDVYLVIEGDDIPTTRVKIANTIRLHLRKRICASSIPVCATYLERLFIEYTAENDHIFTLLGAVIDGKSREELKETHLAIPLGNTHVIFGFGGVNVETFD